MCKVKKNIFLTGIIAFLISCATAPLQERSDAIFAFNAAKKIEAVICSPKQFYLSQKEMSKADSLLSSKDFSNSKTYYRKARKHAERAEFNCLLKNQKEQY